MVDRHHHADHTTTSRPSVIRTVVTDRRSTEQISFALDHVRSSDSSGKSFRAEHLVAILDDLAEDLIGHHGQDASTLRDRIAVERRRVAE